MWFSYQLYTGADDHFAWMEQGNSMVFISPYLYVMAGDHFAFVPLLLYYTTLCFQIIVGVVYTS